MPLYHVVLKLERMHCMRFMYLALVFAFYLVGKSTVACALSQSFHQRGKLSYILDGDNVRHGLNRDLGFKAEDRAENIRRIGNSCSSGYLFLSVFQRFALLNCKVVAVIKCLWLISFRQPVRFRCWIMNFYNLIASFSLPIYSRGGSKAVCMCWSYLYCQFDFSLQKGSGCMPCIITRWGFY